MKAHVEMVGSVSRGFFRWVESPTIYTGQDAEDHGPIALGIRGNAYPFASNEAAGRWVDANSEYGDFVIHGVKS